MSGGWVSSTVMMSGFFCSVCSIPSQRPSRNDHIFGDLEIEHPDRQEISPVLEAELERGLGVNGTDGPRANL